MSTNLFNPIDKRKYPSRWPLYRGKQLFCVIDKRSDKGTEDLLSVSHITGITPRSQKNVTMFKSESLIGYKLCQMGDIVANTMWTWQGAIGVSKYEGVVSPAYNVYRQRKDYFNSIYLDMLLREHQLVDVYHSLSTGIRPSRLRLYPDVFLTIEFPVPPRAEQDQIVRFLDWKVSEINKLIGIRRKEIQELEKLFWIVIVNASSKVKQKNISEWKKVRVKQICRMQSGTNLISQVIDKNGNYPVYGGNGLRGYYKNYTNDGQYVIIGRQGALAGNVHLVEGRFWATDHAIVVYCSKFLIPRYAYYLFTGMNLNQYAFNAAAQPGLSVTKILNLQCDVPSVARQLEIADRLDKICMQLKKIVNNTKKKIKLLQELKSVIISDVVTGKIDVRNIPVPEYEHVDDLAADDGEDNDEETGVQGEED